MQETDKGMGNTMGKSTNHSDKLRNSLSSVASSLRARPVELRGPFKSSATQAKRLIAAK